MHRVDGCSSFYTLVYYPEFICLSPDWWTHPPEFPLPVWHNGYQILLTHSPFLSPLQLFNLLFYHFKIILFHQNLYRFSVENVKNTSTLIFITISLYFYCEGGIIVPIVPQVPAAGASRTACGTCRTTHGASCITLGAL